MDINIICIFGVSKAMELEIKNFAKMKTLQIVENKSRRNITIDANKLIGHSTKSLYIREGYLNGTLFLSQKGNGANGSGDVCKLYTDDSVEVNPNLFDRISILANKANAVI